MSDPAFKLGDWVKVNYTDFVGKIVELRGKLGPGGREVYRIEFGKKRYIEVLEEQMIPTSKPRKPPRKAIFISTVSGSGECYYEVVAVFTKDYLIEPFLEKLNARNTNDSTSFYVGDYNPPPKNPINLEDL